jgi:hypothetical protein
MQQHPKLTTFLLKQIIMHHAFCMIPGRFVIVIYTVMPVVEQLAHLLEQDVIGSKVHG